MKRTRSNLWLFALIALTAVSFAVSLLATRPIVDAVRDLNLDADSRKTWLNLASIGSFCVLLSLLALFSTSLLVGGRRTFDFLGLTRSGFGGVDLMACAIGCTFLAYVGFFLRGQFFGEPSGHLRAWDQVLGAGAGGWGLQVALLATLAVGPAFAEEIVFRGLLFRGLLTRLPAAIALPFVALAFAASHEDLQHIVAVIPMAIWLTLLAWRSGSLWPSILAHLVNNLVAGALGAIGAASSGHISGWVHALAWTVAFPCFVIGVRVMLRRPSTDSREEPK